MSGKVYVAHVEWHTYESDFYGVFSTAKKAKAIFPEVLHWEHSVENGKTAWVAEGQNKDYVIIKTKIDDVIGYLS